MSEEIIYQINVEPRNNGLWMFAYHSEEAAIKILKQSNYFVHNILDKPNYQPDRWIRLDIDDAGETSLVNTAYINSLNLVD